MKLRNQLFSAKNPTLGGMDKTSEGISGKCINDPLQEPQAKFDEVEDSA